MGNALSYQETLSKILGPLNEMSPIAKAVEEQQRISKSLIGPLEQMHKQLLPVQNMADQLKPVLNGLSEACREATMSARNLSFPKITVSYPENDDEIPPPVNRELFLAKERERQISDLKEEIISLKAEIKTEREERKMNGCIEYPEMYRNRPDLVEKLFERAGISVNKHESRYEYSPQELQVLSYSAQFRKDYAKLIEIGYMRRKEDGFLEWLKTKQSLAEYFGAQEKHGKWCDIENLFQQKGLNHLLSVANSKSKDFEKLEKLLEM